METKTTEQKAKAYDEAIEKIKYVMEHGVQPAFNKEDLYGIFPELAQSEDEKIRKKIIEYIKTGTYHKDWIDWLEKQGEQKDSDVDFKDFKAKDWYVSNVDGKIHNIYHSDKVEPKFNNGDWIVWQNKCYKVNYNGCGYKLVDQNGLSTSLGYRTIDENAHHWDITKDAKPGDVLASNVLISKYNKPFIYNGNHNSTHVGAYCGISTENRFNVATKKCRWTSNVNIRPATKEQRDLLFQKMKEAGYKWDAEKKELKKIEQKPTKNIVEIWKDMRLEVYQQTSGNKHESNDSDDTTKMFSLNDIDEIFEKIAETIEKKGGEEWQNTES